MDTEKAAEKVRPFIKEMLQKASKPGEFSNTDKLVSTGRLDSLFVVDLILFLETEFKLDFSQDRVTGMDVDSVDDIVRLVGQKKSL